MQAQLLGDYRPPSSWKRGGFLIRFFWFLVGKPLFACWLPGTPWRKFLLYLCGAKLGKGGRIKPGVIITHPWMLTIGNDCWLGEHSWIDNLAPVNIGDSVCISQGAYLCTGNHNFKKPGFDLRLGPITIESQAWIGAKAIIAPSSVIGAGSVVCLGSVVTGNVSSLEIVCGNPANKVGMR